MNSSFLVHLLSSACWFFQRNFKKLVPGLVPVGERGTVHAPCVAIRINLVRLYKLFADLKSVAPSNPNYLVTNARLHAASPTLLVYCRIPFAGNLPVVEAVTPKSSSHRPVETAFLSPTLSFSARFSTR